MASGFASADAIGFSVRVHGRDLLPKYEQLKNGNGEFPEPGGRKTVATLLGEGADCSVSQRVLSVAQGLKYKRRREAGVV